MPKRNFAVEGHALPFRRMMFEIHVAAICVVLIASEATIPECRYIGRIDKTLESVVVLLFDVTGGGAVPGSG